MIRTQESTGKTVDEARAKACALLGVQADDLNVSYEVLEMPQKTGFLGLKTTPAKVRKTGRSFAMEPMNPYERRIIHSAISKMEGVRSESKGEGRDRRVVIYSTAPDAQTENTYGERRGRGGNRNGRRPGGNRNGGYRGERRSNGGYRGSRSGAPRGPRPSGVPERTYAPRDAESAAPVAPKRTERVDDFADFSFGKIEL